MKNQETTTINFVGPKVLNTKVVKNVCTIQLDFNDGRGSQEITIKRGKDFFMWMDLPYQIRKFSTLEGLQWEFELPQSLMLTLSLMESGEVTEKPFTNMDAMNNQMKDMMEHLGINIHDLMGSSKKNRGSNMTPKKKKRKKRK